MKRIFLILRPIALLGIGLLFAITGAVLAGQPASSAAGLTTGALAAATATPPPTSEVGSTDWITLTSILIVLIVITPILVRRKSWDH